jgi:hypothetical protein
MLFGPVHEELANHLFVLGGTGATGEFVKIAPQFFRF